MRDLIYQLIGDAQLPDILLEMDALCSVSEVLLGHRADTVAQLLALYAALLAHGTDIDAKTAASMIPGVEAAQVSVAMPALETHGRLRRANERVVEFQGRVPLAAHLGSGEKASADMMSLDASRHLWSARVDPRRRTYAAGIYTHLLNRWGIVYDQPIVLNERQAEVAIENEGGNCHFHGYTPAAETVVLGCAKQRKEALVKSGKLEASWQALQHSQIEKIEGKKGKEWKVSFKDPAAKDKSKEALYMFFTITGNFIVANLTGN